MRPLHLQRCIAALTLSFILPALAAPGMRAAVVDHGRIRVVTLPRPRAAAGQVLVKLKFASVNPADWKQASAPASAESAAATSAIPGYDGSGLIVAVGAGVAGYHVGDAVMLWSPAQGTYADYVAVPAHSITRKPASLGFEQAAGLAHAGLTAWNMLVDVAHVHTGQQVLVLGGAGGVGSAAVQIAKNNGAFVIATASASHAEYLKSLGADRVIDYNTQHFEEQLRNIDIAIDTVDIDNANRALAVLRPGGYLVSLNGLPEPQQCALRAVTCASRTLTGIPIGVALKQFADWSEKGRFRVHIDRIFDLTEVERAWQYSQGGHTCGKSVIRIAP